MSLMIRLDLRGGDGTADAQLQQLRISGDRVERRSQLVRHRRQEAALSPVRVDRLGAALLQLHGLLAQLRGQQVQFLRAHFGRLPRRLFAGEPSRVVELLQLRCPSLGEVARDLAVADEPSAFVPDGGDEHVRPEAAAVLAHTFAFLLERALARRNLQLARHLAGRHLFGRVEERHVLPDDLVGRVSLDATRALIPRRDRPIRLEHEDGVVVHTLHQQAKSLLALPECRFGRSPRGEVSRDLGEADQLPLRVAERGDHDVRPEERAILAHAPSFLLEVPFAGGRLELVFRMAARDHLLRVEDGEVLPDRFVRGVALELLRACIPAEDVAVRIQREDRVVADALDQQSVQFAGLVGEIADVCVACRCRSSRHIHRPRAGCSRILIRCHGTRREAGMRVLALSIILKLVPTRRVRARSNRQHHGATQTMSRSKCRRTRP
jgi:hypothetical protein